MTNGLCCVGMEIHKLAISKLGYLRNVVDHACLAANPADRDRVSEFFIYTGALLDIGNIDATKRINSRQFFRPPRADLVQDRRVLELRRQDDIGSPTDIFNGDVVGGRRRRREENLARIGVNAICNFTSCRLNKAFRIAALKMGAGRIAVYVFEKRLHRIQRFLSHRRGGRMIQINPVQIITSVLYMAIDQRHVAVWSVVDKIAPLCIVLINRLRGIIR